MTNEAKELNFKFDLILINLNCHKWLVTIISNSADYLYFTNGASLKYCEDPIKLHMERALRGMMGSTNISWNPEAL